MKILNYKLIMMVCVISFLLYSCNDSITSTNSQHTVQFRDVIANKTIVIKTIANGESVEPLAETDVTNPNDACYTYDVAEWYTDAKLTKKFNFGTSISKNTTLYLKWALITEHPIDSDKDGYLEICDPAHLLYIAKNTTTLTGKYELVSDIKIIDSTNFPIGSSNLIFSGELKGNNKTIRGLDLSDRKSSDLGLFAKITRGARLSNFILDHNGIGATDNDGFNVGGIAGLVTRNGTAGYVIRNVGVISTSGASIQGNYYVGGLVGYYDAQSEDSIIAGYNKSAINGNAAIGGLVGEGRGSIHGYNKGDVSGKFSVGGLVGHTQYPYITVTGFSSGTITGSHNIGGLVGFPTTKEVQIYGYFSGTIRATYRNVGGLIGWLFPDDSIVRGYVLPEARIESTYKEKDVHVGGLLGYLENTPVIFEGYMRGDVYAPNSLPGGTYIPEATADFGTIMSLILSGENVIGIYSDEVEVVRAGDSLENTDYPPRDIRKITAENYLNQGDFTGGYALGKNGARGKFTFGDKIGEWVFQEGKWPAINLELDEHFAGDGAPDDTVIGDDIDEQSLEHNVASETP